MGEGPAEFIDEGALRPFENHSLYQAATTVERQVLDETRLLWESSEFEQLRIAHRNGVAAEVRINGRPVLYESEWTYSHGSAIFEEGGFLLGPSAFNVAGQGIMTVMHKLYRLRTSNVTLRGLHRELAALETLDAHAWVDKFIPAFLNR